MDVTSEERVDALRENKRLLSKTRHIGYAYCLVCMCMSILCILWVHFQRRCICFINYVLLQSKLSFLFEEYTDIYTRHTCLLDRFAAFGRDFILFLRSISNVYTHTDD